MQPALLLILAAVVPAGTAPAAPAETAPSELWAFDLASCSPAEQTLAVTLQGLANRDQPRLWMVGRGMHAVIQEELEREGTRLRRATSVWDLLVRFRPQVAGGIACRLDTDSLNVATSLAGPKRAVVVDESLLARAEEAGLRLLLDARGLDEVGAFARFRNVWAGGVAVEQTEKKNAHLRDFAVARHAFTFAGLAEDARVRILRRLGPGAMVFGWGGDEHEWVRQVSRAGGAGIPADWSLNLSALARLPASIPAPPARDPAPVREGERIVAFVMTDGDNIQWMGGGFCHDRGFWASPHRGAFPMTWEMAPVLAEVAPRVLRYFYRTATPADGFVTGPSGAGYVYPHHLPDRKAFAEQTARLMRRSRLDVVTVLNSGGDMTEARELLERPEVLGALYKDYAPYNARRGALAWHHGKPCLAYRYLLWEPEADKSPAGVAAAIGQLPASPATDPNSYAAVNVHAWSFKGIGGPMEAVRRTIDRLPPRTRVVTARELLVLLRRHFGTPVGAAGR